MATTSLFATIFARLPPDARLFADDVVPNFGVPRSAPPQSPWAPAAGEDIAANDDGAGEEEDEDDVVDLVAAAARKQKAPTKARSLLAARTAAAAAAAAAGDPSAASAASGAPADRGVEFELLDDDAAVREALNFSMGNPLYDPDEHGAGGRGPKDGSTAAGHATAATTAASGPEGGAIVPGDGRTYRGRCCNFNGDRGFGFIRPLAAGQEDLYFTADAIVRAPGPPPDADAALHARIAALIPLMLFPDEEVEFRAERRDGSAKLVALDITGPNGQPVRAQSKQMLTRSSGAIRHWNAEKQYGFIAPSDGGSDVFFHASSVVWDPAVVPPHLQQRAGRGAAAAHLVEVGFIVEYSAYDRPGQKPCAVAVTDAGARPINPATVPRSEHYAGKAGGSGAVAVNAADSGAGATELGGDGAASRLGVKRSRDTVLGAPDEGSLFAAPPAPIFAGSLGVGAAGLQHQSQHQQTAQHQQAQQPADVDDGYADW